MYRIMGGMNHRTKELIDLAKAHRRATGIEMATIATKVMNDGKFFDRIENGGGFTMRTYDKVKDWFRIHTPTRPKASLNGTSETVNIISQG